MVHLRQSEQALHHLTHLLVLLANFYAPPFLVDFNTNKRFYDENLAI